MKQFLCLLLSFLSFCDIIASARNLQDSNEGTLFRRVDNRILEDYDGLVDEMAASEAHRQHFRPLGQQRQEGYQERGLSAGRVEMLNAQRRAQQRPGQVRRPQSAGSLLAENFDPSRADPKGALTCKGPRPGWPLPVFDDWNPNLVENDDDALQIICAKAQYGGKVPSSHGPQSIPGYCQKTDHIVREVARLLHFPSSQIPGYIYLAPGAYTIDPSRKANIDGYPGRQSLRNPRLELYCAYRCWCSTWQDQPAEIFPNERVAVPQRQVVQTGQMTYQITIDAYDDFQNPAAKLHVADKDQVGTLLFGKPQNPLIASTTSHDGLGLDRTTYGQVVTLDQDNKITCNNDLPLPTHIPMPPPMRWEDFQSNTRLCATTMNGEYPYQDGGHPLANAGTFCRRPYSHYQLLSRLPLVDPVEVEYASLWWADEFTPRLEWTWTGNYQFAAAVRFHCYQVCECKHGASKKASGDRNFLLISDRSALQKITKGLQLLFKSPSGKQSSSPIGPQKSPSSVRDQQKTWSCTADGTDSCTGGIWDESTYGPPPGMLPPATKPQIQALQDDDVNSPSLPMCGTTCAGPAGKTCQSEPSQSGCQCVVPPLSLAKYLGLDPVAPVALCLETLLLGSVIRQIASNQAKNLGKRAFDEGEDVDLEGLMKVRNESLEHREGDKLTFENQWACPCNSTYISKACCGSMDGHIWEAPEYKLGELRR